MRRTSYWLVLFAIACAPAIAKLHPVPLDAKTDAAKCIECHADRAKGAHVHSAMATGCLSCHEIRATKTDTRVKLKTVTTVSLCLSCHADKSATGIKNRVHAPAVRDCTTCHDPHQSANANLLLKPASGGKAENLCLGCHNTGLNVPEKGSRHAALDSGCSTCHVTHKTGERGKREFDFHLTKDVPALCIDCHDPKDEALAKAHNHQPIAGSDCLTCHDPHQSRSPKLLQAFLHAPFSDKDSCATCHRAAKDGKVVLTHASSRELCLSCHAEKAEQIKNAKVQHPGAAGDCTDCHSPHAGRSPGFPKPNAVAICLGCHSDIAEQGKKAHPHQPAFEQGCATCHEPHGGENEHLLRAATVNTLCLECHGPEPKVQKLETEHMVAIFDGKVKLPGKYFLGVPSLPLQYGAGHPVERHPISDLKDPQDPSKVLTAINCLTCHQSHAGAERGMLVNDQPDNQAFCSTCHMAMMRKPEVK